MDAYMNVYIYGHPNIHLKPYPNNKLHFHLKFNMTVHMQDYAPHNITGPIKAYHHFNGPWKKSVTDSLTHRTHPHVQHYYIFFKLLFVTHRIQNVNHSTQKLTMITRRGHNVVRLDWVSFLPALPLVLVLGAACSCKADRSPTKKVSMIYKCKCSISFPRTVER